VNSPELSKAENHFCTAGPGDEKLHWVVAPMLMIMVEPSPGFPFGGDQPSCLVVA
jgi:hypothetical protein